MTIFFIVSLIASAVGVISGLGGGVIIKPVLDAVSGYPISQISFMSACTVMTMALVSVLRSRKAADTRIDGRRGTSLAIGAAIGGVAGKQIFNYAISGISSSVVGSIQSAILVLLCVLVFIYTLRKNNIKRHNLQNTVMCLLLGICLGTISAFIGIGGGPINVMAISFFLGMDTKTTAIHSIYAIFFSQLFSVIFSLATDTVPQLEPVSLIIMILGGIIGALLGSSLSKKMSAKHIDKLFLWMLVIVIAIASYNLWNYISG